MPRLLPLALVAVLGCRGDGRPASPPGDDPLTSPTAAAPTDAPPPRPITPARLDALAALTVPGHQVRVVARGAADVALAVTSPDGTVATVTASACLGCVALDLDTWRARRAELATLWAPGAEAEPPAADTSLAITSLELGAILIDAHRADGTSVTVAHWNDGATQLQSICDQPAAACTPVIRAALTAALAALQ